MTTPKELQSNSLPRPEDEVELLDYIEVLVRRRWLIFWVTTCCVALATGHVALQTEAFRSEAIILPSDSHDYLDLTNNPQRRDRQSFYVDILESTSLSRQVLLNAYDYHLDGVPVQGDLLLYFELTSLHRGFEALEGVTEFDSERSGVVTISATTRSPKLSAQIANEYVSQLRLYNQRTHRALVDSQLVFMSGRLNEIRGQLDSLHQELVAFQRRNRDVEPQKISPRATDAALEYQRRLNEIEIHSDLYSTVLNQHEIARVEAKKKMTDFEILALAEPAEFGEKTSLRMAGLFSILVGLVVSAVAAFVVEYLARHRASGRMDFILGELRNDVERFRQFFGRP